MFFFQVNDPIHILAACLTHVLCSLFHVLNYFSCFYSQQILYHTKFKIIVLTVSFNSPGHIGKGPTVLQHVGIKAR